MEKEKIIVVDRSDINDLLPIVAKLEDNAIREISYVETMDMAMDELQSLELSTIPSW